MIRGLRRRSAGTWLAFECVSERCCLLPLLSGALTGLLEVIPPALHAAAQGCVPCGTCHRLRRHLVTAGQGSGTPCILYIRSVQL